MGGKEEGRQGRERESERESARGGERAREEARAQESESERESARERERERESARARERERERESERGVAGNKRAHLIFVIGLTKHLKGLGAVFQLPAPNSPPHTSTHHTPARATHQHRARKGAAGRGPRLHYRLLTLCPGAY